MGKDSEYQGSTIGFRATLRDPDSISRRFQQYSNAALGLAERAYEASPSIMPGRRTFAAAGLAASMFALASYPEALGRAAGDLEAGYKAGTTQTALCTDDCSTARSIGESAGGWVADFTKGYKGTGPGS